MNKLIIMLSIFFVIASCKEETKPVVVGTNDSGEELVVNETGDTVVYTPPVTNVEVENVDNIEKVEENETGVKETADGTYDFGLNLKEGKTYPFKIYTSAKSSESDGKNSRSISQESTTVIDYKVKDIQEGNFVLDATYKRFSESATDGSKKMSFDTDGPAPTEDFLKDRWKFNKAVVGKTFTIEVDENGKVQNITNLYKVREQVKNAMKADLKEEEVKALDGLLSSALSDEAMKQMFEESMAFYPKDPVKIGDSWDRTESQGPASSKVTYTFDSIDDGVATIKVSGSSSANDSQTDPNGSGMKMFQSLEGTVSGTVHIDANSGWIEDAEMNKKEIIRITQEFQGQKRNMSSETTSKSKINK